MTLRVSIGWPSECGRYAADSPRQSRSYAALRHACRCDDVAATRSGVSRTAWVSRVWPVAIRWLGSDLRSGQRREYACSSSSIATGRRERPPRQAAHSPRPLSGNSGMVLVYKCYGCEWVRMWYCTHGCFRDLRCEWVRMGANGCEWVRMGANADLRGSPLLERRYFGI